MTITEQESWTTRDARHQGGDAAVHARADRGGRDPGAQVRVRRPELGRVRAHDDRADRERGLERRAPRPAHRRDARATAPRRPAEAVSRSAARSSWCSRASRRARSTWRAP